MMLVSLLLLAGASAAQPHAAPAKGQVPTDKVVCKMVLEPGSRIPIRVCRLGQEWELLAKDVQDDVRGSRNQRVIGLNPGS